MSTCKKEIKLGLKKLSPFPPHKHVLFSKTWNLSQKSPLPKIIEKCNQFISSFNRDPSPSLPQRASMNTHLLSPPTHHHKNKKSTKFAPTWICRSKPSPPCFFFFFFFYDKSVKVGSVEQTDKQLTLSGSGFCFTTKIPTNEIGIKIFYMRHCDPKR